LLHTRPFSPDSQGGDRGFESRTGHQKIELDLTNTECLTNATRRGQRGKAPSTRDAIGVGSRRFTWGGRQHYLASDNDRAVVSAALAAWLANPSEPKRANRFRAPAPDNPALYLPLLQVEHVAKGLVCEVLRRLLKRTSVHHCLVGIWSEVGPLIGRSSQV
jgi:hypothetical protein